MIRSIKALEYPILAGKSVSILVKTFFFWRSPVFGRKKRLNFRAFREISSQFLNKPCDSDSRRMKIRIKVVCSFLTLSKKPPPPFFQILATRLLFAMSFKFSRTSKTVVINSFCCFLFLNYAKKLGLLRATRLMPKTSTSFLRNEFLRNVFLETLLQKLIFCLKFDFTTIFLNYSTGIFFKSAKKILERNVSAKEDPCCKSNKSLASNRRMEYPMTRFL